VAQSAGIKELFDLSAWRKLARRFLGFEPDIVQAWEGTLNSIWFFLSYLFRWKSKKNRVL